jgi:DNA mismatch repair ATPase MutS
MQAPTVVSIVATHLTEVAVACANDRRATLACFEGTESATDITFDYQLKAGISAQRLGMTLLAREGILDMMSRIRDGFRDAASLRAE